MCCRMYQDFTGVTLTEGFEKGSCSALRRFYEGFVQGYTNIARVLLKTAGFWGVSVLLHAYYLGHDPEILYKPNTNTKIIFVWYIGGV